MGHTVSDSVNGCTIAELSVQAKSTLRVGTTAAMHAASGPTYRERLGARRALLERAVARIVDICSALGDVRAGAAAFHAQQAAEKALKAACVIATTIHRGHMSLRICSTSFPTTRKSSAKKYLMQPP